MSSLFQRLNADDRALIEAQWCELPVKLGQIARGLGLEVFASTLRPGISGEIRKESLNGQIKYIIRINRHESKERQRFTLAHEISHFLLHRSEIGDGISDSVLYRSSLPNVLEYEANRLAAEIIMPTAKVIELKNEYANIDDYALTELAKKFFVSKDAMSIRLGV